MFSLYSQHYIEEYGRDPSPRHSAKAAQLLMFWRYWKGDKRLQHCVGFDRRMVWLL